MTEWISTTSQLPTKADADKAGCVLGWDVNGGARLANWETIKVDGHISHWIKLPEIPDEMRDSIDMDMPSDMLTYFTEAKCKHCMHFAERARAYPELCEGCGNQRNHRLILRRYIEAVQVSGGGSGGVK